MPKTQRHCGAWTASAPRRTSNQDWQSPSDGEAEITKLKDGRTALAYKAENAVDMETAAIVAVTTHGGAAADTATVQATVIEAGIAVAGLIAEKTPEGKYEVHPEGSKKSWRTPNRPSLTDQPTVIGIAPQSEIRRFRHGLLAGNPQVGPCAAVFRKLRHAIPGWRQLVCRRLACWECAGSVCPPHGSRT
jgi:hypothetical protein